MTRYALTRRATLQIAAAGLALAAGRTRAGETVRISYQRSSTLLTLIKQNGKLEKKLARFGYEVSWHELNGNALLQALNAGSVDIHADVADAYALFTQAADAPLTYFAKETSAPGAEAIVVPADSPIRKVADLRSRRVTVLKGSGAHYLLLTALKRAGLGTGDIDLRFLDQQDGVSAYSTGAVDALAIWDPLLGVQLKDGRSRVLADGRDTGVEYGRYYTATTPLRCRASGRAARRFRRVAGDRSLGQGQSAGGCAASRAAMGQPAVRRRRAGQWPAQLRDRAGPARRTRRTAADRRQFSRGRLDQPRAEGDRDPDLESEQGLIGPDREFKKPVDARHRDRRACAAISSSRPGSASLRRPVRLPRERANADDEPQGEDQPGRGDDANRLEGSVCVGPRRRQTDDGAEQRPKPRQRQDGDGRAQEGGVGGARRGTSGPGRVFCRVGRRERERADGGHGRIEVHRSSTCCV
jgi:ABC-type nitrate/sulfonate/bicarbonate transport system substrate-binding protein